LTKPPSASRDEKPTVGDHAWRWSREGVQQRIRTMTPADALLTVEQYNARQFRNVAAQLDTGICLGGLTLAETADVERRVAELRQRATAWGQ
jgi:hypothetical protein